MQASNPLWFVKFFRRFALNLSASGQVIGDDGLLPMASFCALCHTPVASGYRYCARCAKYPESIRPIPVFPLTWTPKKSAFYSDMIAYKRSQDQQAINRLGTLATWVSWHQECLHTTCFQPDLCTVVPSSKEKSPNTELQKLAQWLTGAPLMTTQYAGSTPNQRTFQPELYAVPQPVRDKRIIIIDDSWVTGASATSLAQTLLNTGARNVAIIVFARVLDRSWPPNHDLITKFDQLEGQYRYDLGICPYTRQPCPVCRNLGL